MTLRLEPMTRSEYDDWHSYAVSGYAQEFVDSGIMDAEAAAERAQKDFEELLPDGLATQDHLIWSAHVDDEPRPVGAIWVKLVPERRPPHSFVYALDVYAQYRRRGYGQAIMETAIEQVRALEVGSMGLNVFGHNDTAKRLYDRLGFRVTSTSMKLDLTTDDSARQGT